MCLKNSCSKNFHKMYWGPFLGNCLGPAAFLKTKLVTNDSCFKNTRKVHRKTRTTKSVL